MIPEAAVEAAKEAMYQEEISGPRAGASLDALARAALEAAAPHMMQEADLTRWKLGALKEWSDAMVSESDSPQYGRDVRTILEVGSMDKAREIDAL